MQIGRKILNKIAEVSVVKYETLSESFALFRRDLLWSENYKNILVPVYNDITVVDALENVVFLTYLKNKYNTNVILTLSPANKYIEVYKLFSHLYNEMIFCKRLYDLEKVVGNKNITKLFYNDSIDLFDDIKHYTEKSVSMNIDQFCDNIDSKFNDKYIISAFDESDIFKFLSSAKINPTNVHIIDHTKSIVDNVILVISSLGYINISNNKTLDYIVPFTGISTNFVNASIIYNPIFTYCIDNNNTKISTYDK